MSRGPGRMVVMLPEQQFLDLWGAARPGAGPAVSGTGADPTGEVSVEVVGGRFERVDIDDDWRREINPGSLAQAVLMANAVAVAGGLGLDCDPAVVRDYSPGQSATMMADIIAQAKVDSAEPVVDPGLQRGCRRLLPCRR